MYEKKIQSKEDRLDTLPRKGSLRYVTSNFYNPSLLQNVHEEKSWFGLLKNLRPLNRGCVKTFQGGVLKFFKI